MTASDVGVWIAAVSATSALAGTFGGTIYQGRQLREQAQLIRRQVAALDLQAEDLRYSASAHYSEQASHIKLESWVSRLWPKLTGDTPPTTGRFHRSDEAAIITSALVVNSSDRPVHQVQVRFENRDFARWARIDGGATTLLAPLEGLGSAHSAWFDSDYQEAYTIGFVTVRFTDIHGRHWQADATGDFFEVVSRDW